MKSYAGIKRGIDERKIMKRITLIRMKVSLINVTHPLDAVVTRENSDRSSGRLLSPLATHTLSQV